MIDWELIHRGDPHEDLAWLCLKAWRFGVSRSRWADSAASTSSSPPTKRAGGRAVDRDTLRWWLVAKTFTWGVGCMLQADIHLSGRVRSVDLAAVGPPHRRAGVGPHRAPRTRRRARPRRAAPPAAELPDDDRYGRPTARELLDTVREFLSERVATSDDRGLAYEARVAANILAIVERELAQERVDHGLDRAGDDWDTLALLVRDRLAVASPKHVSLPPTIATS